MHIDKLARWTLFTGMALAGVDLVFDTYYVGNSAWLDIVTYESQDAMASPLEFGMIPVLLMLVVRAAIYCGIARVLWLYTRGATGGLNALLTLGVCALGGVCNMYGTSAIYEAGHSLGFVSVYWMAIPSIALDVVLWCVTLPAIVLVWCQRRRRTQEGITHQNDVNRRLGAIRG